MIKRNKREVIGILREFRDIMKEDNEMQEGKNEIMRRGIEKE